MTIRRILAAASLLFVAGCSMFHPGTDNAPAYIVFFHYDSVALSPEARAIVDLAAKAVRDTHPSMVELAGFTEKTALPTSRPFAEQRFDIVAQALIADGVDPKLLSHVPLDQPEAVLSPTADRRVEIRLINKHY